MKDVIFKETPLRRALLSAVAVLLVLGGCKNTYYKTWEKLGWAKRDILVDRVEDGRDDQQKAKEQFKTTLEQFQALTNFQGGDLEARYKKLNSAYEACKGRADAVSERIKSIDTVAQDMFREWSTELTQYENAELRRSSEQKLNATKDRYSQLIAVMRKSETSMAPVLKAFHDQVLYLKHNLNASAIASLQNTTTEISTDVQNLIKEMEASINEANAFIGQIKG
jgi:DNA-binding ferritin-like protein